MKLESLHLHGFKSFADRTKLEFRDGVTAIIGSNGCGKSNIADAVRWVLGEQRASAIRGSKMEEVIFQGTARRRPLNFAEVSLVFDNTQGRVPVPQSELEVSRKVFREGGSEYSLNRNSCRLRDIHNLLRDTGLGSNAYAIIEAGMIETLLSDRAEERRLLFEEAAGIGRYKDSRQAATRRLESAEADLARLGDLIAEVESKVRSLSRQKKKAERHGELQARRLDLEVAIATRELAGLNEALHDAERRRQELDQEQRSAAAERATAETVVEERRIEAAELAQRRGEAAERLDGVRRALDAREREVLLADERRAHANLRIEQLAREADALRGRRRAVQSEIQRAGEERGRVSERLETVRARLAAQGEVTREAREELAAERAAVEATASRARTLAREIATAEGERASAERRGREAQERIAQLGAEQTRLEGELAQLSDQMELWVSRSDELRDRLTAAGRLVDEARAAAEAARGREAEAREALRTAEDRLSRLAAQVDAREALERGYQGFAPAVAAVMAARARFPGVLGPLADFLPAAGKGKAEVRALESYLGPLLQALVVEDLAAAREVRTWFREEWDGGGSLMLLPVEALPAAGGGAAWAEALLAEVVVVDGDALAEHLPGRSRVGRDGEVVDARGIVRLPELGDGEGILGRREALGRLREERDAAAHERGAAEAALEAARAALRDAEARERELAEKRAGLETELRRAELDSAAHEHRTDRLRRDREAVGTELERLAATVSAAGEQMAALEARLAELTAAVDEAAAADDAARARLADLEAHWERARDDESELRVEVARAEAELREAERRAAAAEQDLAGADRRAAAIEREAQEQRSARDELAGLRERAGTEIEQLFAARDEHSAALALLDSRLSEVDSELAELGERVRIARRRETEDGEERHRLELKAAELRSHIERARERLEVEWGRPWDALVAAATAVEDGDVDAWRAELQEARRQLEGLGPVNMLAVEEHEEEARRLDFLTEQRDDLVTARDDLVSAIRQINRTARDLFLETFEAVRENFQRVFLSLFQGGECDIRLEDPDDPLESLVEIHASPKGKRTQRIHLLSGGERTLTALALLFALYLVKPSPFCILDEIDAPLDESNVERFIQLLQDFKRETQFIVITHHPRTMEAADWVYGVTMEEPGISSIVGVEMLGAWTAENRVA